MIEQPRVIIYTDGACDPNPGPGGWAAILRSSGYEKVLSGGEPQTTNNRMELTAALQALRALDDPGGTFGRDDTSQVDLYTDSEYLQRGITEWMATWKARNWKRKGGKLANVDLWQALDEVLTRHHVHWHWLKGHAGHPGNERVDKLAWQAIPR